MNFNIISPMEELLRPFFNTGVVGRSFKKGMNSVQVINPRDFTSDVHKTIDDRPYGGGDGMVMLAEPLTRSLESIAPECRGEVYIMSPQGRVWNDTWCRDLAKKSHLTLICGRYSGVDQRFLQMHNIQEISIGDYVLSGGELGAAVVIDSLARQVPGVLGHSLSADQDSFAQGLLEAPLYTRPVHYQGFDVPEVLWEGHHKKIAKYQSQISIIVTLWKRPDLFIKWWPHSGESIETMETTFGALDPKTLRNLGWTHSQVLEKWNAVKTQLKDLKNG